VVKEVNTKRYIGFCGWISSEVCEISDVEIHNAHIEKASNKIDTQKRNDKLLSLGPEKSSHELTHPKINQHASGINDKVSITFKNEHKSSLTHPK
jgi:hypothetical protein